MKFTLFIALWLCYTLAATAQTLPVRVGSHSFTIQWIAFNKAKPGTVMIKSLGKDEYSIEGEQRDKLKNDYITIKGTFLARGRELKFNGKIVSRISYINGGQPCESTGLVIFKASGKRKYWRLQSMLNCDGESTDYIDIFF
ncbi:hypothetical protein HH214_16265 [Mucilaginibacter robiniae]|uniref:Uncharacterized protein n=1 Tax=Mucilaginibacter robiniae TaxID=2728022 RepID=A0A7L5E2P6_9SPHI|nr:hypothetical protein [Mucilaginibacter robiniae]QJD97311.1 hypothetical protein HH214_16265 [Mucilaginibacter robiniae]